MLLKAIEEGATYVNILTVQYPGGGSAAKSPAERVSRGRRAPMT